MTAVAAAIRAAQAGDSAGWRRALAGADAQLALCREFGLPTTTNERGESVSAWAFERSDVLHAGTTTMVVDVCTRVPVTGMEPSRLALKLVMPGAPPVDTGAVAAASDATALPEVRSCGERHIAMRWVPEETLRQRLVRLDAEEAEQHGDARAASGSAPATGAPADPATRAVHISRTRIELADRVATSVASAMKTLGVPHGGLTPDDIVLLDNAAEPGKDVVILDPASWFGQEASHREDLQRFGATLLEVLRGPRPSAGVDSRLQELWMALPAYAELIEDLSDAKVPGIVMATESADAPAGDHAPEPTWQDVRRRFEDASKLSSTLLGIEGVDSTGFLNLGRLLTFRLRLGTLRRFLQQVQDNAESRRPVRERALRWSALAAVGFWLADAILIASFTLLDADFPGDVDDDVEEVIPGAIRLVYRLAPQDGEFDDHLISRMLALSFGALAILYYLNLLASLRFDRVRDFKRAFHAETFARLMPFLLNAIILAGIIRPDSWGPITHPWIILSLAGMVPVTICNYLLWRVVEAGTLVEPGTDSGRSAAKVRADLREWWSLMIGYLVALVVLAIGLNVNLDIEGMRVFPLHDVVFYALLIGVVVNLGKLYLSNIVQYGAYFRSGVQRAAFHAARWERLNPGEDLGKAVDEYKRGRSKTKEEKRLPLPMSKVFWPPALLRLPSTLARDANPRLSEAGRRDIERTAWAAVVLWVCCLLLALAQVTIFDWGASWAVVLLAVHFASLTLVAFAGIYGSLSTEPIADRHPRLSRRVEPYLRVVPLAALYASAMIGMMLPKSIEPFDAPWAFLMVTGMIPVIVANRAMCRVVQEAKPLIAATDPTRATELVTDFAQNWRVMFQYVLILSVLVLGLNFGLGDDEVLFDDVVLHVLVVAVGVNIGKLYMSNIVQFSGYVRSGFNRAVDALADEPPARV